MPWNLSSLELVIESHVKWDEKGMIQISSSIILVDWLMMALEKES